MSEFLVCEGVSVDGLARCRAGMGSARLRTVRDDKDAAGTVLAALRGTDLVIVVDAPADVVDRMCEDLRRLGTVRYQVGDPVVPVAADRGLDDEQQALLRELLAGRTLGEAAARLHISRRTADRRLAAAKNSLGTSSTSAALVLAARRGVGRPGSGGFA